MNAQELATFAHHDKIRNVAAGKRLLVCEPFTAVNTHEGGQVEISVGATLRVVNNQKFSIVHCEVALNGRVHAIGIFPKDFHCVEVKPS